MELRELSQGSCQVTVLRLALRLPGHRLSILFPFGPKALKTGGYQSSRREILEARKSSRPVPIGREPLRIVDGGLGRIVCV